MKHFWHIRYAVPTILVLYIVWQALVVSVPFKAFSALTAPKPAIGVLLPAGRVERVIEGVALMYEPVYVDVTLPLRARQVTFTITTTTESAPIRLGVRQGPGWDYVFPDAEMTEQGGTRTYKIMVSNWQYLEPTYALRFLISSPKLVPGDVVFKDAQVTIEREPFSFSWLKQRIQNLL